MASGTENLLDSPTDEKITVKQKKKINYKMQGGGYTNWQVQQIRGCIHVKSNAWALPSK